MKPDLPSRALQELARHHGIETCYRGMAGDQRHATAETLVAILRALGVDIEAARDARQVLRSAQQARVRAPWEPVQVVWLGQTRALALRLPASAANQALRLDWRFEDGSTLTQAPPRCAGSRASAGAWGGDAVLEFQASVPGSLAEGYHQLECAAGRVLFRALVIAAPQKPRIPATACRPWGLFAPLYGLHSDRSLGVGDYGDLERWIHWLAQQGASLVGTLPLLPVFLDEPYEPSPYAPVTRLGWNECYLELPRVPELAGCASARRLWDLAEIRSKSDAWTCERLVDYREVMRLKRRVLEVLSREFFARTSVRRDLFEKFLREQPEVACYARFRAVMERRRQPWPAWPARLRDGSLRAADGSLRAERYHAYAQWLAHEQMAQLGRTSRQLGVALYLDLPLGTHRDGYDAWRHQDVFAGNASGGAAPDPVFTRGQDWGFAPLHPERSRRHGHGYWAACLRHHLRHAGVLRLDHIMGLHRLFWIPAGLPATHGAYVRYPADELYAILCLEAHRHRAVIVGENLGTVPAEVNERLPRHGVMGMFVAQYEFRAPPRAPLRRVPGEVIASLNTHDMAPFHGWCLGLDVRDRWRLGLCSGRQMRRERASRGRIIESMTKVLQRAGRLTDNRPTFEVFTRALLAQLAASDARYLLVNVEDLWLETEPQNVPGTWRERPNWRRRLRQSLEQMAGDPGLRNLLSTINRLRHEKQRGSARASRRQAW